MVEYDDRPGQTFTVKKEELRRKRWHGVPPEWYDAIIEADNNDGTYKIKYCRDGFVTLRQSANGIRFSHVTVAQWVGG